MQTDVTVGAGRSTKRPAPTRDGADARSLAVGAGCAALVLLLAAGTVLFTTGTRLTRDVFTVGLTTLAAGCWERCWWCCGPATRSAGASWPPGLASWLGCSPSSTLPTGCSPIRDRCRVPRWPVAGLLDLPAGPDPDVRAGPALLPRWARRADQTVRQQILWLAYAVAVTAIAFVVDAAVALAAPASHTAVFKVVQLVCYQWAIDPADPLTDSLTTGDHWGTTSPTWWAWCSGSRAPER
jgi:hypothetical protein